MRFLISLNWIFDITNSIHGIINDVKIWITDIWIEFVISLNQITDIIDSIQRYHEIDFLISLIPFADITNSKFWHHQF